MEVCGKKAEGQTMGVSFAKASAEDFEFYCEPCDSEGTLVEAHGYCKNCEEFLCATCYASHRRVRLTKNHIFLDKEKMPKVQKSKKRETDCTVECPRHTKEVIIYYCKTHDGVGCHVCMSSNHSDCMSEYIPDIADGTKDTLEFKSMLKELDDVVFDAIQDEKRANDNIKTVDSCYDTAIKDIKMFKQDVNKEMDKMEEVLFEEARKAKENAKSTMKDTLNDCENVKENVKKMKADLMQTDGSASQIFITMKQGKTQLGKCMKSLQKHRLDEKSINISFKRNADVTDNLKKAFDIGNVVITMETSKDQRILIPTFCGNLDVKSKTDMSVCEIVDIDLLSPQELVMADFNNKSVKVVNTSQHKVTHELKMSPQPRRLTVLAKDKFAVATSLDVLIVSKTNKLKICHKVSRGDCEAITNIKNSLLLVYSYPFPQVQLETCDGKKSQTLLTDERKATFSNPRHIAISADEMSIYISDYYSYNKLIRFAITGEIMNVYKNETDKDFIKQPRGIAVADNGGVFVCDFFGNSIRMFSADLSNQRKILTETDGIKRPLSIYFCNRENKLFVCSDDCNDILMFGLKW